MGMSEINSEGNFQRKERKERGRKEKKKGKHDSRWETEIPGL